MRAWLVLVPVVLVTLLGIPLQWASVALKLPTRRLIPLIYHRFLLRMIGLRVREVGAPADVRPLILVSNHMSWLDIVVLGSRFPLGFVAKSEVASWPGIGLLAKLQRTVFVDRSSRTATAKVNDAIAQRLREGDPVVLFAEGTSSDGNRVLPFRSALLGATREAFGTGAPASVQPLAIAYVGLGGIPLGRALRPRLAWYGDMDLAPHLLAILKRGGVDVEVRFGVPLSGEDRKALTARAHGASREMLAHALNGRTA